MIVIYLPASAGRKPSKLFNASLIAFTTAGLPCNWNSQQSSPVKLFGAGNHKTMPLSIKSLDFGCHSFRSVAYLGRMPWGFVELVFVSVLRAFTAFGPDTRITATPHLPYPFSKIYQLNNFIKNFIFSYFYPFPRKAISLILLKKPK